MVIDFSFQRVFVFYTCRCNSWCVEAAVIQADITVLAQSENQSLVSCSQTTQGAKEEKSPWITMFVLASVISAILRLFK